MSVLLASVVTCATRRRALLPPLLQTMRRVVRAGLARTVMSVLLASVVTCASRLPAWLQTSAAKAGLGHCAMSAQLALVATCVTYRWMSSSQSGLATATSTLLLFPPSALAQG